MRLVEIQTKQHTPVVVDGLSLPILILSVHNRCNCRCMMCDIWKRSENIEMRAAMLDRHRESMQRLGVRHVVLTGGEPLLHSDLASLCNFFREEGIQLTLLTSGLLLSKHAELVAEYFDDVIISLDGPQEVHDAIRGIRGGYKLIEQGISAVRVLRSDLLMTCRTTVQKANHQHLRHTVSAAKETGLNGISFLAADLTSTAFNRTLEWSPSRQSEIALRSEELTALECEIERLIADYATEINSGFIAESPEKLRCLPLRFREHLLDLPGEAPQCNAPWVSAVIELDGSLRPCFFHQPVASLQAMTLEEAWRSRAANAFRSGLNVKNDPTCQRCVCSLNRRA